MGALKAQTWLLVMRKCTPQRHTCNQTRWAGMLVCMLASVARCSTAAPPCVSRMPAQNCYALETLLGRTDWSTDKFNSMVELEAFVGKYMTSGDAFPHETILTMK